MKNLAIFDLDHTLINTDSDNAFPKFLIEQGLLDADYAAAQNEKFYQDYLSGCLNVADFVRFQISPIAHLPPAQRRGVLFHEIFPADVFADAPSKLSVALGKDIAGDVVVGDLAKMPHLLVGGMTGSGKSVGVNAMIMSMLYKAAPDEVRFIMIDPKMLELSVYEGIPHLLCPVVTDMREAGNALNWCVAEMEKRYRLLAYAGVRNLASYNEKIQAAQAAEKPLFNPFSLNPDEPEPLETLPQIVVVIDELQVCSMT